MKFIMFDQEQKERKSSKIKTTMLFQDVRVSNKVLHVSEKKIFFVGTFLCKFQLIIQKDIFLFI
jgi:hypothetical protein